MTVTNSYWDTQTSGQATSAGGTGKTTAQMKSQSTFTGWDFLHIWSIRAAVNNGYPFFGVGRRRSIPSAPSLPTHPRRRLDVF